MFGRKKKTETFTNYYVRPVYEITVYCDGAPYEVYYVDKCDEITTKLKELKEIYFTSLYTFGCKRVSLVDIEHPFKDERKVGKK